MNCQYYNEGHCSLVRLLVAKYTQQSPVVPVTAAQCNVCLAFGDPSESKPTEVVTALARVASSEHPALVQLNQQVRQKVQPKKTDITDADWKCKGVGDIFHDVLAERYDVPEGCGGCAETRRQMNQRGIERCRETAYSIAADVFPRAARWAIFDAAWRDTINAAADLVVGMLTFRGPITKIAELVIEACNRAERLGLAPRPFPESVTVLVTAFNRPRHLERFVKSLRHWYPTAKLVIADNGNEYAAVAEDERTTYLKLPFDCGLSASRNAGVAAIGTEFVLLCEDDFYVTAETRIQPLVDVLKAEPAIGWIGGDVRNADGKLNPAAYKFPREPIVPMLSDLPCGVQVGMCDWTLNFALVRREMASSVKWDESLPVGEHVEYFRCVADDGRWAVAWTPDSAIGHDTDRNDPNEFKPFRDRALSFAYHAQSKREGLPPLLPDSAFAPIFEPLRGLTVGIVDAGGNAGDRIIHEAERQLCTRFGVKWRTFKPGESTAGLDKLLVFGGGNMGTPYEAGRRIRNAALSSGVPCVLLPQSWETWESIDGYEAAYARERASQSLVPGTLLGPDMALGWACHENMPDPVEQLGVFLRNDREGIHGGGTDAITLARTPIEYLRLASKYEHIVTDRLHFAISGLILRRKVTLLPNSYHKNRSMWETWLSGLGCEWSDGVPTCVNRHS